MQFSCEFFIAKNAQGSLINEACVQIHSPNDKIHFFTILLLGECDSSKVDTENEWFLGILKSTIKDLKNEVAI